MDIVIVFLMRQTTEVKGEGTGGGFGITALGIQKQSRLKLHTRTLSFFLGIWMLVLKTVEVHEAEGGAVTNIKDCGYCHCKCLCY